MGPRIATGLSADDSGVASYAEAADRAAHDLGDAPVDLAVVFAGAPNVPDAAAGLAAVRERLGAGALVGCGAQG
ncbi:MAG: hypothetical protein H0V03_09470, partial [Thermoleophilaceae bacterium]|nr:hypothetical protein [Thermoleophilaceae bacterium]